MASQAKIFNFNITELPKLLARVFWKQSPAFPLPFRLSNSYDVEIEVALQALNFAFCTQVPICQTKLRKNGTCGCTTGAKICVLKSQHNQNYSVYFVKRPPPLRFARRLFCSIPNVNHMKRKLKLRRRREILSFVLTELPN